MDLTDALESWLQICAAGMGVTATMAWYCARLPEASHVQKQMGHCEYAYCMP